MADPAEVDVWMPEPGGLALDVAQRRLFATCDNQIVVMVDADSGKAFIELKDNGKGVMADLLEPGRLPGRLEIHPSAPPSTPTIATRTMATTTMGQVRPTA